MRSTGYVVDDLPPPESIAEIMRREGHGGIDTFFTGHGGGANGAARAAWLRHDEKRGRGNGEDPS